MNLEHLELYRNTFTKKSTGGILLVDSLFECYVLEDVDRKLEAGGIKIPGETCIPRGKYRIELYDSPKFGRETLQLVDVPQFTNVQIHGGNKPEDTEGCILTGEERSEAHPDWISQSQKALLELKARLVPAIRSGRQVWITIT